MSRKKPRASRSARSSSDASRRSARSSRPASRQPGRADTRKPAPSRPPQRRRFDLAFIDMFIVALVLVIVLMVAGIFWLALTGGL